MTKANIFKLNLKEDDLNKRIHRFISIENLEEIILFGKLTIPKIECWDDPYENFFFNTKMTVSHVDRDPTDFSNSLLEIKSRLYGQCWTFTDESDALWRIYSGNSRGIKITTTLRKLVELVQYSELANDNVCVGRVEYFKFDDIQKFVKGFKHFSKMDSEFLFKTLLMKRQEFSHENEVRVIYNSGHDFKEKLKHYPISINEFVESITFDPRIENRYETLYRKLLLKLGFKNTITKSELYKFDALSIVVT